MKKHTAGNVLFILASVGIIWFLFTFFKDKGANAVIGVDIETSFGEALARVAISGTAVVISPIIPSEDSTGDDYSSSNIPISASNSPEGFVPVELTISNQYSSCEIILILQSYDKAVPDDIIADVEFTSIFGDTQFIENVCFLGIHYEAFKYESKPIRIRLPEHIAPCIDTCSIRIRKYRIDNHLIEISNLEMHPIEELLEILNKSIVKNNVDEFGWILDETPGFIRCPNCNERVSKDYMKYQRACKNCGFPRSKSEN